MNRYNIPYIAFICQEYIILHCSNCGRTGRARCEFLFLDTKNRENQSLTDACGATWPPRSVRARLMRLRHCATRDGTVRFSIGNGMCHNLGQRTYSVAAVYRTEIIENSRLLHTEKIWPAGKVGSTASAPRNPKKKCSPSVHTNCVPAIIVDCTQIAPRPYYNSARIASQRKNVMLLSNHI